MKMKTETVQGTLNRCMMSLHLNVDTPSMCIKKQFARAQKSLIDTCYEFDKLNDMKETDELQEA